MRSALLHDDDEMKKRDLSGTIQYNDSRSARTGMIFTVQCTGMPVLHAFVPKARDPI